MPLPRETADVLLRAHNVLLLRAHNVLLKCYRDMKMHTAAMDLVEGMSARCVCERACLLPVGHEGLSQAAILLCKSEVV